MPFPLQLSAGTPAASWKTCTIVPVVEYLDHAACHCFNFRGRLLHLDASDPFDLLPQIA